MHTSQFWFDHFTHNLKNERVDWTISPSLSRAEKKVILKSLQAWQLGETSEGKHLIQASTNYAKKMNDALYVPAVELFIKEEQKHGNNLGNYLDRIGEKRIKKNWGDSLFRKVRYYNTNMEIWTLAVITVESTAQLFYQSLKDATNCQLLKQICTDILIDEAFHIDFQMERLLRIWHTKKPFAKFMRYYFYKLFFYFTICVVWFAHRHVFEAGRNTLPVYLRKMHVKFKKTLARTRNTLPLSASDVEDVMFS